MSAEFTITVKTSKTEYEVTATAESWCQTPTGPVKLAEKDFSITNDKSFGKLVSSIRESVKYDGEELVTLLAVDEVVKDSFHRINTWRLVNNE